MTDRENDVLKAMVHGVTSKRSLALHLGVSENTAKFHARSILDKLHLHDRAKAVAHAVRNGLVKREDVKG